MIESSQKDYGINYVSEIDKAKNGNKYQIQPVNQIPTGEQQLEKAKKEGWGESAIRTILQPVQAFLETTGPGLATSFFQLLAAGEMYDPEGISQLRLASEQAGIPFDEEKYMEAANSIMKYIPTVSNIGREIEQETGIPLEPNEWYQKMLRFGTGVGRMTPGNITEKVMAGAKAGGTSQALQYVGVPEPIADIAGIGASGVKTEPKILAAEEQALKQTAEDFNLRKFHGMENEKPPSITPVISAEKQAGLQKELSESSKKAIDEIIKQKIPVKRLKEMGTNLEEAYRTAYSEARITAEDMGKKPIDFKNVISWINKEVKKTLGSSPSLSKQQDIYLKILNKEKRRLLKPKEPPPENKIQLFSHTGEPIPEIKKLREIKNATADQLLNQYQNYNDNVKGIWRKPEFSGAENTVKNAYAGLNEELIKSINKANPQLGSELKFANKLFHETSKLDQVEGILSKSFKDGYDPNKLSRTLSNRRERKFLERNLGKDAIQDMEKIAKYGQKAQEKVFNHLKNPAKVSEYLQNMTPTQLALLVGFKSHIGVIPYLSKAAINRIQGQLFTRKPTRTAYLKFMNEGFKLGSNPKPLFLSAQRLEKAIEKEFGSEKDLLEITDQE